MKLSLGFAQNIYPNISKHSVISSFFFITIFIRSMYVCLSCKACWPFLGIHFSHNPIYPMHRPFINHSSKLLYLPITLTNYHVFDPLISIESSFRLICLSENKSNRLPPSLINHHSPQKTHVETHLDATDCWWLLYIALICIPCIYNISILDHIGPYYPNIFIIFLGFKPEHMQSLPMLPMLLKSPHRYATLRPYGPRHLRP